MAICNLQSEQGNNLTYLRACPHIPHLAPSIQHNAQTPTSHTTPSKVREIPFRVFGVETRTA
ncbi:hypothetical protein IAQ61_002772 [Plenodomus lingam]|uniref:uncharacterized protein n=1 Tax=Leptosphaeria maculans TaxID=5022 RepID=UPI003324204A|nr:hypothetical protein IAQ61_002772 [Plenodomus lingam]